MKKSILKRKDLIMDKKILVQIVNKHCTNIVEKTSGIAPEYLGSHETHNSMSKMYL